MPITEIHKFLCDHRAIVPCEERIRIIGEELLDQKESGNEA